MSDAVVDTMTALRSLPAEQLRATTLASSNEVKEEDIWSRYHEAVAEVRRLWGEPEVGPTGKAYEGPGWRAGYQGECPSPDAYFRQLYCKALRIGWWKRAGFVHAVILTGHDANTLQLLQLAVAQATDLLRSQTNELHNRFENSAPILRVADMSVSLRYYVEVLGFQNADWGTDDFTSVNRDRAGIYLCRGGQGQPGTWVWIGVEDVEALYEEYKTSGAKIRHAPRNYPWALEMKVEDPDGHVLRFGSEAKAHLPFDSWSD